MRNENEKLERNGNGMFAYTASTLIIKPVMCFFSAQLMGGGVFVVFLGGTPGLATFLDWFYLNQARYVFRSAYWVNVFDKLFGYQYHLSATLAKRLLSQALLVISYAFLPIVWRNITHTTLP